MRWLLLKDLQILRRSPLIVALLIAYPVALGVLIGFALSGDDSQPRVAFLNEIPDDEQFQIGGDEEGSIATSPASSSASGSSASTSSSREEAEQKVEDGDVIAALILPEDLLDKLESLASLNPQQPAGRGARQRGRPGQGEPRRRPDPGADHRGEPDPLPADLRRGRHLPRPADRGRRASTCR